MQIRLSDADRERLGAPEFLDGDIKTLPVREAVALEEATGMSWADAEEAMRPRFREDDAGRWVSWGPTGFQLRIWLGLHRAGIEAEYADLGSIEISHLSGWHPVPKVDPGKGQGSAGDEPSTPSRSRTTGPRTRSKKSPTST